MNREATSSLAESLIKALVPSSSTDSLLCSHLRNWAIRELRNDAQGSHRREWQDVSKAIDGLTHIARVRVQDDLAEALEGVKGDLEGLRRKGKGREWDGDGGITVANLPQHVHFLLSLSNPPKASTHDFAEYYFTRQPDTGPTPDQILFDEIMAPPFRGDHWGEGYDEEVLDGWSESSRSGSETTSSDDEQVWTPSSSRVAKMSKGTTKVADDREDEEGRMRDARAVLEKLGERAYWRAPGVELEAVKDGVYGWKELTTGVATLALSERLSSSHSRLKLISAAQLQREMLFALTGRPNLLLSFTTESPYCTINPDRPNTLHYSRFALTGILTRLQATASKLAHLRQFINTPVTESATRTAFVEAIRVVLQDFATWVADLETRLIQGVETPSATDAGTPLALLLKLDTDHTDVIDLLVSSLPSVDTPVGLTNTLHTLYASSRQSCSPSTTQRLLSVFIATAEPLWSSLGKWLNKGMPIPSALLDEESLGGEDLDDEKPFSGDFFIKRDRDVSWADEDFWECAWVVDEKGWPTWLDEGSKERMIEAGKARGLLKGLKGVEGASRVKAEWRSLEELLGGERAEEVTSTLQVYIGPICDLAIFRMRSVLEDECGLMAHLEAIEGTMFMASSGVIDDWTRWLYAQVGSGKKTWADFQTLSNTYRESIRSHGEIWMNAPAIRLSLASRLKAETGIAAIGLIRVDYQVPFPLSQLFSPTSTELRSDVFTFLLQFGYGRHLMHHIRSDGLRGLGSAGKGMPKEMRAMSDLKQRLLWIIDTVWIWLHDRVIGPQTALYRQRLTETMSLGEMIQLELAHTRSIRKYCFLHDSTSVINGCIHDLLELAQSLSDNFHSAQAELIPTSIHPTHPAAISHVTGRSRRRQAKPHAVRRRRPDTPSTSTETSDSEGGESEDDGGPNDENKSTESATITQELSLEKRLEKLRGRLGEVVQVFKEGVDELSFGDSALGKEGDQGEREVWAMLRFALEDWKDGADIRGIDM